MKSAFVALLVVTYLSSTEACSCFRVSGRRESLRDGICRDDVYIARVIGAMCNCLPAEGETRNISCQNYRFPQSSGSTVVTAELTNRGRCYAEDGPYTGHLRVCSNLDTEIIPQGYSLDGPDSSDTVPVQNVTRSTDFGSCYLSCPFNNPENSAGDGDNVIQPCYYEIVVTEAIKGNITDGQTLMRAGPDVLTSCGNNDAQLRLNEEYVAGVGGGCQMIDEWSSRDSYTASELQQLRDYAASFESGRLACGSLGLLPSLALLLIAVAMSVTLFG